MDAKGIDDLSKEVNNISRQPSLAREPSDFNAIEGSVSGVDANSKTVIPRLDIAMLVVGTRGDVQPFLPVAKRLQEFGHRVRLATHVMFADFVKSAGVEFYPLGGDPRDLARYMQRNKGLPLAPGELTIQRNQFKAIVESVQPACIESDIETGAPFRAQAIISNPNVYGQIHVAEALGVPVHILFTFPWTPTSEFPPPVAHLPKSPGNRLSYAIFDFCIWLVMRELINDLRTKKLKLPAIPFLSLYSGSVHHLPTAYMWSRHVLAKPKDLNDGLKYKPPEELVDWMNKGPKPIYIGFGSMLLDDPRKTTEIILETLKNTGQRGILNSGWGDLGVFSEILEYVFVIEDCPHDWLFPRCSGVVHHGGAGTTASGLRAGCPTSIVPFFGDQFFWGDTIHQKGLGPEPIPITHLNVESLSNAIRFMLQPQVKSRAMEIARLIENEDGVANAVDSFHRHLTHASMTVDHPPLEQHDCPNPVQRFFVQIGELCRKVCS